jgi:hypothetical protein
MRNHNFWLFLSDPRFGFGFHEVQKVALCRSGHPIHARGGADGAFAESHVDLQLDQEPAPDAWQGLGQGHAAHMVAEFEKAHVYFARSRFDQASRRAIAEGAEKRVETRAARRPCLRDYPGIGREFFQ